MYAHAAEARSKTAKGNQRKLDRIREIHSAGLDVLPAVVATYEREQDAFDHEADLIATMTGLTNILARGGGWALAPEEFQRRLAQRQQAIAARKLERDRKWLSVWLEKAEKWPGVTFPGLKDGDAKAEEFMMLVRGMVHGQALGV